VSSSEPFLPLICWSSQNKNANISVLSIHPHDCANMPGSSLRKKLNKRQAKDNLKSPYASEDEASSNATPRVPTAATESYSALDDLANTPPPPSSESSISRVVSPSSTTMNRYKLRAPAAVAPSATGIPKPKGPREDVSLGKAAVEQESDDDEPPSSTRCNTSPGSPIVEKADGLEFAGANINFLASSFTRPGSNKRAKTADVLPQSISAKNNVYIKVPARRSSRSQARREQRQDSAGTLEAEAVRVGKPAETPRALTIRKLNDRARTPSPSKQGPDELQMKDANIGNTPFNSPNPDTARPRLSRKETLINLVRSSSASPPDESFVYPSPDHVPASPCADDLTISPAPSPSLERRSSPAFKSTPRESFVVVNPPRYDPTRLAIHQWCSHLGSTSRPDAPYGWPKRWTCCHCHALTIVEQADCAKLECGHARCSGGCKIVTGVEVGGRL